MIYDIFYVSKQQVNVDSWQQFRQRFPSAQKIDNVTSIDDIKKKSFTKFFWLVWDDLIIADDFAFDYRVEKWDESYIHVWLNGNTFDGINLFPKNSKVTRKEFDHRFFVNKKEINVVASHPKPFEIYNINTYDEYLNAKEHCTTEMFWAIRNDLIITDDFKFSEHYVPVYDHFHRNITHIFKNGEWYDGVELYSKHIIITKKEFDHRFPIEKKQHNIVASNPKPYDIFFISYNEPNAEENYQRLIKRFPRAKRISGINGIHNAHIAAANLSSTELFWVVDADALITRKFNFEFDYVPHYHKGERDILLETVHVWCSTNPVNGLIYGYGGVKLLPRQKTIDMNKNTTDMTTSISKNFKLINKISNITEFNTDEYSTWRSAFRECVKLSSKAIDRSYDVETDNRLNSWCTMGEKEQFGIYSIGGAQAGKSYGEKNIADPEALMKINDFEWLKTQYDTWCNEQSK